MDGNWVNQKTCINEEIAVCPYIALNVYFPKIKKKVWIIIIIIYNWREEAGMKATFAMADDRRGN